MSKALQVSGQRWDKTFSFMHSASDRNMGRNNANCYVKGD